MESSEAQKHTVGKYVVVAEEAETGERVPRIDVGEGNPPALNTSLDVGPQRVLVHVRDWPARGAPVPGAPTRGTLEHHLLEKSCANRQILIGGADAVAPVTSVGAVVTGKGHLDVGLPALGLEALDGRHDPRLDPVGEGLRDVAQGLLGDVLTPDLAVGGAHAKVERS